MKKLWLILANWWIKLIYNECPKCGEYGVSFSHTEHFTPGEPDVHHCKFCNEYFI